MVISELHHGIYLVPEGNPDAIVWVVFANEQVGTRFEEFFAPGNMPSLVGKQVYCDCTGVRYGIGDGVIFRIAEARLFAR